MKFSGLSTTTTDTDTFLVGLKIVLGVPSDYKFSIADLAAYLGLSSSAVVKNADILAQTTNTGIWAYIAPATCTLQLSGYLNVTAYTSGTITLRISWTDEQGAVHSGTAFSASVSATGYVFINPVNLRVLAGSTVSASVIFTGTATADMGMTLQQLA